MTDNIINFAKAKSDANKHRSHHFISLDVYLNSDNSEVWAEVTNVGDNDIDQSWHGFVADLLRRLAWLSDGMAYDMDSTLGQPVANIAVFTDSRVSTRWNDDLIKTANQVVWVRQQLQCCIDEIDDFIKEGKL